jgi:hypothetical protein
MTQNELYVVPSGSIVTKEYRHSVMMLTKILFRLDIINEEQALNIATKFQILFV